jgi:autotransporter-associated beta strand protein
VDSNVTGLAVFRFSVVVAATFCFASLSYVDDAAAFILGYNWLGGTGSAGHENDWSVFSNWDANIDPNGAGITVIFGNAGATGTADLKAGVQTVGKVYFNSSTPTTITNVGAGTGTLVLNNSGSDAAINGSGSGHEISSAVDLLLQSNLDITIYGHNDSLAIAGNISDDGSHRRIIETGAGKLILSGSNTYTGDTVIAGGTLDVTSTGAIEDGSNITIGAAWPSGSESSARAANPIPSVAVPEPATAVLLAFALPGAACFLRRKWRIFT